MNKTEHVLGTIFDELDTNKDGLVTYKEYMTWVVLNISKVVR
jgi:hypothetical protein